MNENGTGLPCLLFIAGIVVGVVSVVRRIKKSPSKHRESYIQRASCCYYSYIGERVVIHRRGNRDGVIIYRRQFKEIMDDKIYGDETLTEMSDTVPVLAAIPNKGTKGHYRYYRISFQKRIRRFFPIPIKTDSFFLR